MSLGARRSRNDGGGGRAVETKSRKNNKFYGVAKIDFHGNNLRRHLS